MLSRPRTANLVHPRDQLMLTMDRVYRYRMTTTSGGNLSIREANGDIWITPARVDKGSLRRQDMVCVHPDGKTEGLHRPSSEFPFHQAIYAARPDLGAIVHAHPVALVAFSLIGQAPDTRLFHQARTVCGEAGFAPYGLPGSTELGHKIATKFGESHNCVILENHGAAVAGTDLQNAFQRFETFEFCAKTIIKARMLGEVRYLTEEEIELPRATAKELPEFERGDPDGKEKELRRQLCEFVRRGYQQRLLISTEGSFSARLDDTSFLITPYRLDRSSVDLQDIVLVSDGKTEAGKVASRASRNHEAIYRQHPDIHAVVNAYPVNATAFSVTGSPVNCRTIPESYVFLREVNWIPYGVQFRDSAALAQRISPRNPVAVLENDGVLVGGTSVLDAFDRLEVLESTAEALINSHAIGEPAPMSDAVIRELSRAFFDE